MVGPLIAAGYAGLAGLAGLGIGSIAGEVESKKDASAAQNMSGGSTGGTPSQAGFSLLDFSSPSQELQDQRSFTTDRSRTNTSIDASQETQTYNPQFTDSRTTTLIVESPNANVTSKKDASQASSTQPTQSVPIRMSQPRTFTSSPSAQGGSQGVNFTAVAAIAAAGLVGYALIEGRTK